MNEKNMRILIVIPATLVLETVGPLYFNCNLIIDWSYTQFSATCAYLLFFAGRCDVKLVQRNKEAFKEAQQENKIHTIMKLQRKSQWKIYYVWDHPYLFLEAHMDNICRQICQYISATNGGHFFIDMCIPVNRGHQHPDSVYWGACWQSSAATVKRNNLTYFSVK